MLDDNRLPPLSSHTIRVVDISQAIVKNIYIFVF